MFQHKLYGPPPKTPIFCPQKKVYVPHFLGSHAKKKGDPLKLFRGHFWSSKNGGPPNGPFWATKSSLFFPALNHRFLQTPLVDRLVSFQRRRDDNKKCVFGGRALGAERKIVLREYKIPPPPPPRKSPKITQKF